MLEYELTIDTKGKMTVVWCTTLTVN